MNNLVKIMVIEDNPDIQELVSIILTQIGKFNIIICKSGQEAINKIDQFSPQLILLDVMMPMMDGPTTMAKIRELPSGKEVPIIFMTARVQSQEINEYLELGAIGVIEKPFDPGNLSNDILKIWSENLNTPI
jgi:two-component system OmpR family response regulator